MENDDRTSKLTIILGTNGTGKSTLVKNLLLDAQRHDPANFKALVIMPDDIEWNGFELVDLDKKEDFVFRGIKKHVFRPGHTLQKLELFKRGIIVFDDCRAYTKAATADEIHALMIRRRQRMVDVFAVGHGFNEVPPVFFTFASDIILFRTVDNMIRRKNYINCYDQMYKAQQRINQKASKEQHYCEHIKFT